MQISACFFHEEEVYHLKNTEKENKKTGVLQQGKVKGVSQGGVSIEVFPVSNHLKIPA